MVKVHFTRQRDGSTCQGCGFDNLSKPIFVIDSSDWLTRLCIDCLKDVDKQTKNLMEWKNKNGS